MPVVNYCKACNQEVPPEENCPICGKRLTKSGLRLCFIKKYRSITDWFSWSGVLRVWGPLWLLLFLIPLGLEYQNTGINGLAAMLENRYLFVMLLVMVLFLVLLFFVLLCQGEETICYTLTAEGVQARSYLLHPTALQLYSRFLTKASLEELLRGETRLPSEGLALVKRDMIPWEKIRKVKCWRQGREILLYRPRFWRIFVIHCTAEDYEETEAWIRAKMRKYKKSPVLPRQPAHKKRTGKRRKNA